MNWLNKEVTWIQFNDNTHNLKYLPESKDYYPTYLEVIAVVIISPFTWALLFIGWLLLR